MCIAAPGRVVQIEGREARVKYAGVGVRRAMVGVEGLLVGDWVMVQMGVVIQVVEGERAEELEQSWREKNGGGE